MIDILKDLETGVYFLSDDDLVIDWQQLEAAQDWMIFRLDGRSITNEEGYLQKLSQSLKSPDYCTENFDAMLDCLRTIAVYHSGADRYVIFYTDYHAFRSHNKQQSDLALKIFQYAGLTWQKRRPDLRLNIMLIGQKHELPEFVQML